MRAGNRCGSWLQLAAPPPPAYFHRYGHRLVGPSWIDGFRTAANSRPRFGLLSQILHDGAAATLYEDTPGTAGDSLCTTLGTGIAIGLALDGKFRRPRQGG